MQEFNISIRSILVKSELISKLGIENEETNSKTSIAKEKDSFIVYCIY